MSVPSPDSRPVRVDRHKLLLLLAVVIIAATGAYHLSKALTAKSDVFYLTFLGFQWFEPEQAAAALARHEAAAPDQGAELERRRQSSRNYPVAALAAYGAHRLAPGQFVLPIAASLVIPFLLGLAIAAIGIALVPEISGAFALAAATMAFASFLPGPAPSDQLTHFGGVDNLLNLVVLAVSPGAAFSPLSLWPKCSLELIFIAALANRWSGRLGAGYALLMLTIPFHLTLGGLLVLGFAIMDLVLRPRALSPLVLLPALAVASVALFLGQWRVVADAGMLPLALLLVGALSVLAFVVMRRLAALRDAVPIAWCDTGALLIAALVATPAAMVLLSVSGTSGDYAAPQAAFGQLAARLIVLASTALIFAASFALARYLATRKAELATLGVVGVAALFTVYGAAGSWWWEGRFLPARMHDTAQRSQTEPLTEVYYQALCDLVASGGGETVPACKTKAW